MAATLTYCATTILDFTPGAPHAHDTTAGMFNADRVRAAIRGGGTASGQASPQFTTPLSSGWLSFWAYLPALSASSTPFPMVALVVSGASTGLAVGIMCDTGAICLVRVSTGADVVLGTSAEVLPTGELHKFDMYVGGVSNTVSYPVEIYMDGVLVLEYFGTTTTLGVSTIVAARLENGGGLSTAEAPRLSEIIVCEEPTLKMEAFELYPAGVGADTAWTGTYADIDDLTVSADYIQGNVDEAVESVTVPTRSYRGYCVGMWMRIFGIEVTTTGSSLDAGFRYSDGTYQYTTGINFSTSGAYEFIDWPLDPATSLRWTATTLNTLQLSVRLQYDGSTVMRIFALHANVVFERVSGGFVQIIT